MGEIVKIIESVHNVITVLWVGSIWAIGYISAPVLFSVLENRKLAGEVAGVQFEIIAWLGLACGALLMILTVLRAGRVWQFWVILTMVILVAVGLFGIQPIMQELKASGLVPGSAEVTQFGRFHAAASILYSITSLLGLVLVIKPLPVKHHFFS